ncbi:hypothetical protein EVB32_206 [Rhizobium phage RHph_TM39]|uniref:Uncharacterized protein n=1 Tax=Rhizobium phage RHph_TM30 TaxID=2509764 RepID=A0A7S5RFY3_9CAUD|nr:hypothetical protein PQC16_gp217 [Rhizobium phage RHph_TM30]QIG71687.1 hypothetical protein EVB94_216 [Rhizobium phage RHph_TM40]QIG72050.1 hypothetical protein EVB95_216 [Rhizobium phage RHph_TM2_3B]QIG72413.1 hypothetical protein EVB96_217 [Rhizobium phage RHph_TM3_3_6]QIG77194.1 hypothetical protein EVB32_206 [Rhizobium phage RHph_TM39]QIG77803.1 hypothetical protein EVB64_216 [Rhizobium phage RHph_TM61]
MNISNLEGTLLVNAKEITMIKGSKGSGKSHCAHLLFKDATDKWESVLLIDGPNSKQHIQVNQTTRVIDVAAATVGRSYDKVIYVDNDEKDFKVVSLNSDLRIRQISVGDVD